MTNTLVIKSSILGEHSQSSQLLDHVIQQLDGRRVMCRDLAATPLPMLDGAGAQALRGASELTVQQADVLALSEQLISELQQADTLVIAAPMYNFHIPVQLKAWIDLVCRAGVTFRYTEQGVEGLLNTQKAVVVTTRGGQHRGTPHDMMTDYLKTILTFLGIADIEFVYAEALNMSGEQKQTELQQARAQLDTLLVNT